MVYPTLLRGVNTADNTSGTDIIAFKLCASVPATGVNVTVAGTIVYVVELMVTELAFVNVALPATEMEPLAVEFVNVTLLAVAAVMGHVPFRLDGVTPEMVIVPLPDNPVTLPIIDDVNVTEPPDAVKEPVFTVETMVYCVVKYGNVLVSIVDEMLLPHSVMSILIVLAL